MVVQREMPRYKCHKEVRALKIAAIEIHADNSATIAPDDAGFAVFTTEPGWAERFHGTDEDCGFYVLYENGYTSWSPSDPFIKGYSLA